MARPKSREAILGEIQQLSSSIDALKKKLTEHDKAEAARIGGLAMKAGLGSIAIPEEALAKAFEELVARFRTEYPEVAQPKAKGRRGARPAPEGADAQAE
ncbi:TraC family protein [Methylobacterium aquaticum]|jgi:hypothetical protein|uniref:TraC family protein n=1 Tax=Methylobacterium aquaticum TaxID=270351 RepID=UPI0009E638A4|nr:TraC family protein [Methylobacterium aquaticum]